MMRNHFRNAAGRDAGSALVVAIAVAVIGLALATVVASQAIAAMNGASQDRIRTVEVHSAEGALDAALKTLETTTPCTVAMSVGEAPKAVSATVTIRYYNAAGEVLCTNGTLGGKPTWAVLTSSAVPTAGGTNGLGTQRQIQAKVNLIPKINPSFGAAIFAGGTFGASNNGLIEPADPNHPAQVWVNGSSWSCSNNYTVKGDVIAPSGFVTLSNGCDVDGNVWAKTAFSVSNNSGVTKNVTVLKGAFSASNNATVGGNVSVDGTASVTNGSKVVGTICSTTIGTPCTLPLPVYAPRVLPEVELVWDDWQKAGFGSMKTKGQFGIDVADGSGLTGTKRTNYLAAPCALNNSIKNPVVLSTTKTVYDLRDCPSVTGLTTNNGITFEIRADTAFFVNKFTSTNSLVIRSSTTEAHNVWFIVTDGGTQGNGLAECTARGTYTPGTISFSNQSTVADTISMFAFTPCDLSMQNNSTLRGQLYGKNISTSNNYTLKYSGMGIPGVDLGGDPTTVPAGYSVEIVNKHEIQN